MTISWHIDSAAEYAALAAGCLLLVASVFMCAAMLLLRALEGRRMRGARRARERYRESRG